MALVQKLVTLVVQDNTKMSLEMLIANNAPLVSVRVTKDRRRAQNAARVNSTMLRVLLVANYVSVRRTLVEREETAVASIAQLVGLPIMAVRNVPRAVPVRLVLGVEIALWAMPEQGTTMMRHNVHNVNWAKQQRLKVPLNAMLAMLEDSAKPKVSVQHAQLAFIKTTKVKMNASNAHWESPTLTPKQHAVVVALVRLAATKAIAKIAQLDSIKIPKVK